MTSPKGTPKGQQSSAGYQARPRYCPEEEAGWLSRTTFWYVNSLMRLGAAKHLDAEDLWDVARQDEAARVTAAFDTQLRATASTAHPYGVVWRALARRHGSTLAWTGCVKIVHDLVMFLPPFILEQLLHHITSGGSRQGALGAFGWWWGWGQHRNVTSHFWGGGWGGGSVLICCSAFAGLCMSWQPRVPCYVMTMYGLVCEMNACFQCC